MARWQNIFHAVIGCRSGPAVATQIALTAEATGRADGHHTAQSLMWCAATKRRAFLYIVPRHRAREGGKVQSKAKQQWRQRRLGGQCATHIWRRLWASAAAIAIDAGAIRHAQQLQDVLEVVVLHLIGEPWHPDHLAAPEVSANCTSCRSTPLATMLQLSAATLSTPVQGPAAGNESPRDREHHNHTRSPDSSHIDHSTLQTINFGHRDHRHQYVLDAPVRCRTARG